MKGTTALLLAILAVTAICGGNNLQLQFGSYVARAVGTSGRFSIQCYGGSGSYDYSFNALPAGWSSSGNTITVPNINSINGQSYNIEAVVRDARTGEVLNANIQLTINGVRVAVNQGGAVGGTFGATGAASSASSAATSGSAASVTSSAVTALYSSYEGIPAGATVSTSTYTYSSPAGQPSIPNPAPAIIASAQASYSASRDANTITVDDVKRTAIFNRQITANKAVANLVSIVQKLTANVNAATNDLTVLTQILADAEGANAACEAVVFDLANTKAKIENAIADRETTIADVNGRIEAAKPMLEDLQMQLNKLIKERSAIEAARSPNAAKLADLEQQLANCQASRLALQDQLQNVRDQIANTKVDIQNTRDSAAAAPGEIEQINQQIPIIDNRIADLKAQIVAAEAEKAQLIAERAAAQALIDAAAKEITRLEGVLAGLEAQIPSLEKQIADKQAMCDAIEAELTQFRAELAQIETNYSALLEQIAAQEALVNDKQTEIAGLGNSIGEIPNELKLLRAEHTRVEVALRRQSFLCEATADDVRRAKQNVEAMRVRLNADSDSLRKANANLEAARAEKELADIAVEEIIAVYTNALPFSIVPNGNGLTDAGTPLGNNPSGSPLGPVGVPQEDNKVTIGDLNSYLSSAYGAGVDPARPSTVTNLYPLSVTTISTIAGDTNNLYSFDCSTNSAISGQGFVHSVQPGMIQVDTNSGMKNLQIAGCTNLETTTRGQVLGTGDLVYYKGNSAGSANTIQAQSVTCV